MKSGKRAVAEEIELAKQKNIKTLEELLWKTISQCWCEKL